MEFHYQKESKVQEQWLKDTAIDCFFPTNQLMMHHLVTVSGRRIHCQQFGEPDMDTNGCWLSMTWTSKNGIWFGRQLPDASCSLHDL